MKMKEELKAFGHAALLLAVIFAVDIAFVYFNATVLGGGILVSAIFGGIFGVAVLQVDRMIVMRRRRKKAMKGLKLLHRDDLPFDIAEEIVASLKERHPGCNVVFAGDIPDDDPVKKKMPPPEVLKFLIMANERYHAGLCRDCDAKIPVAPWPPEDENFSYDNDMQGWSSYSTPSGENIRCLLCPKCETGEGHTVELDTVDGTTKIIHDDEKETP